MCELKIFWLLTVNSPMGLPPVSVCFPLDVAAVLSAAIVFVFVAIVVAVVVVAVFVADVIVTVAFAFVIVIVSVNQGFENLPDARLTVGAGVVKEVT